MIKELIEEQLLKEANKPRKKYNIESIKPSSLGSKCLRKLYYEFFKEDPDSSFDLSSVKNFLLGNMIHQEFQKILSSTDHFVMWINHKQEKEFEFVIKCPELSIKYAKLDGIIKFNEKVYVLEIKTTKKDKFATLKKPKDEHIIQGTTYQFVAEECFKNGSFSHIPELKGWNGEISGLIYLYVCCDNLEMKEFQFERKTEIFQQIAEKCFEIQAYAAKRELPPKTSHFCPWCQYQKKCRNNKNI